MRGCPDGDLCCGIECLQGIVDGVSRGQRSRDLDCAQALEVVERLRRHALLDVHEVRQLNHGAVAAAHVDIADVGWRGAIDRRHLHDHIVLFAVALETGYLAAAEHGFQRAADVVDVHADVTQFVAIDLHSHFRRIQSQIGLQVLCAGELANFFQETLDDTAQLRVRDLRHDDVLDGGRTEALTQRRRIDGEDLGAGDGCKLGTQFFSDLLLRLLALFPWFQAQHRVAIHDGREASNGRVGKRLGHLAVYLLDGLHLVASVDRRRTLRRGDCAKDDAAILDR